MNDTIDKLVENFRFFDQCTEENIVFLVDSIERIERRMKGRYCGSIEDKIFQALACVEAAQAFPADAKVCHLEIGVLFGGSLLTKLVALDRFGFSQTVLGLDPFQGYYGEEVDPISQLPVTMETAQDNIAILGPTKPQARLIKAFSGNVGMEDELSGCSLASLMIDGDHSYEGVAADWEKFSPHVLPGGIVLFDDYSDASWPEVTRFVDDLLEKLPKGWDLVGHVDTTLALRRG